MKKNLLLAIAIALVFAFFVGYGIEVFDATPEYNDFCPEIVYEMNTEAECLEAGGVWSSDVLGRGPVPVKLDQDAEPYCQVPPGCYDELDLARARHDRIVFIVALIVGLAAIVVGLILKLETISTGLLAGGVLLLLYGTIRYWQHAENMLKFILLGIALAVLIWIGYKKLDLIDGKKDKRK